MIIFDVELKDDEIKYNEKVLHELTLVDFLKGNFILDVYENKGMYIKGDRKKSSWTTGIKLSEKRKRELNEMWKISNELKHDLYIKVKNEIMENVENNQYLSVGQLSKEKQREFDRLYNKGLIGLINQAQDIGYKKAI